MKRQCTNCGGPSLRMYPRRRVRKGERGWGDIYLCRACWAGKNCFTCANLSLADVYPCSHCLPIRFNNDLPHWTPCAGRVKEAK